ncbi:DNA/RNA helicase domain-containing protein [Kribbella sp. NPDC048928]|uniref:DNA/RNA helicase domain-containing protein n=1 Tax=Kribbella sp. NPDC048928 TaxID=3364111 RepID=UPI00370FFF29
MTLFRQSGAGFVMLTLEQQFELRIAEQMRFHTGRRAAPAEVRSWERSLPVLAQDLEQAGLGKVEVLVEHHLPLTSKRADVVLAGRHPRTGGPSYVVVELKQWSRAAAWEDDRELVLIDGYSDAPRLHPVAQVRGYCDYLADFTKFLDGQSDAVAGAAYLHNAMAEADVRDLYDYPQDSRGQLFTGARRHDFIEFLRSRLDPDVPGSPYADQLINSAVAPSKQLLAVAADEVQRREQFVLVAEQKLAHSLVVHEVERARRRDRKSVVIVTGGPGSGKSVIALSLLGHLARQGRSVLHATGSRSFTLTLRGVAGKRAPRVEKMFKYFHQFMEAEPNDLDVLILDEAHRIRQTSVSRFTPASLRIGRQQVDELIAAARVPVFLLDKHQVVKPGEVGTPEEISRYAAAHGFDVHRVDLDAQFRCGGSEEYVQWVQRLLGLADGEPTDWPGDPAFEVRVADSPEAMEAFLRGKLAAGYGARMSAGYCWPWSKPRADKTLVEDVQISGWARPWNVNSDRKVGDYPPAALWATDPNGFGQVGCIYTAQGFEYDWSGVILGPDLVWRDGRFTTVRDANKDPVFKNRKITDDAAFDSLIRNTYKVLLTRGMTGTVLYSVDPETRDALHQLVSSAD